MCLTLGTPILGTCTREMRLPKTSGFGNWQRLGPVNLRVMGLSGPPAEGLTSRLTPPGDQHKGISFESDWIMNEGDSVANLKAFEGRGRD